MKDLLIYLLNAVVIAENLCCCRDDVATKSKQHESLGH